MKDILDSMPDFLFLLYPLELLLQGETYYHYNSYGKRNKWFFLNLKKEEKIEFNNEEKNKVTEDVNNIEKIAEEFKCSVIISNGNSDIFKISDENNKKNIDLKIQTSIKRMNSRRSSSGGLAIIKSQLKI